MRSLHHIRFARKNMEPQCGGACWLLFRSGLYRFPCSFSEGRSQSRNMQTNSRCSPASMRPCPRLDSVGLCNIYRHESCMHEAFDMACAHLPIQGSTCQEDLWVDRFWIAVSLMKGLVLVPGSVFSMFMYVQIFFPGCVVLSHGNEG